MPGASLTDDIMPCGYNAAMAEIAGAVIQLQSIRQTKGEIFK